MSKHSIDLTTLITQLLTKQHLLTANQLIQSLQTEGETYNKTSVYRALDKMLAEGKVCKHTFRDNEAVYELRSHHHDHLICQNCGKIETVHCQIDSPPDLHGFIIDHHHLTFFGTCGECQAK